MRSRAGSCRRQAFTLAELLVILGIIGFLVLLLFPAIQAAHEASHRQKCSDNLRQLGAALTAYHGVFSRFPPSYSIDIPNYPADVRGLNVQGWAVRLLPYLPDVGANNRYDLRVPAFREVDNPAYGYATADVAIAQSNIQAISKPLSVFTCDSVPSGLGRRTFEASVPANALRPGIPPTSMSWTEAASDYIVNSGIRGDYADFAYAARPDDWPDGATGDRHGVLTPYCKALGWERPSSTSDIKDGLACTIVLGERAGGPDIYVTGGKRASEAVLDRYAATNGAGWGDFLNGENWVKGCLPDGYDNPSGGPCAIKCSSVRGHGYFGFHRGGVQFLMADGSSKFIVDSIDLFVFAAALTREKGDSFEDSEWSPW